MRKRYDKESKPKVALEAVKGEKTIQNMGNLNQVHPNLIALWKRQLLEHAAILFEKEGKDKEAEETARKEEELYRQMGRLRVENHLRGTEPR